MKVVILLIVVAIAFGSIWYFVIYPQQAHFSPLPLSPENQWKTYQHIADPSVPYDVGFSFLYPPELTIHEGVYNPAPVNARQSYISLYADTYWKESNDFSDRVVVEANLWPDLGDTHVYENQLSEPGVTDFVTNSGVQGEKISSTTFSFDTGVRDPNGLKVIIGLDAQMYTESGEAEKQGEQYAADLMGKIAQTLTITTSTPPTPINGSNYLEIPGSTTTISADYRDVGGADPSSKIQNQNINLTQGANAAPLTEWLQYNGLTIESSTSNTVVFGGTVQQIEDTFQTKLRLYINNANLACDINSQSISTPSYLAPLIRGISFKSCFSLIYSKEQNAYVLPPQ